jgi:DNA-binding NtrC family response regulator
MNQRFVEGSAGKSSAPPARSRHVLLVDDDTTILKVCERILGKISGLDIVSCSCSTTAEKLLRSENFDLAILDILMPGMNGLELLRQIRSHDPELSIILFTGSPTLETAVEGLRLGVSDYVIKPILPDEFLSRVKRVLEERQLRQENRLLTRQLGREYSSDQIVSSSQPMKLVLELVDRVSQTNVDALILGEPGVGKELIARTIHAQSGRSGRFIPIHCGDIPDNLLEREFFGFERGVVNDSDFSSIGLLELVGQGTLLIDEVQRLPLSMQSKLVNVLHERAFHRLGGHRKIPFKARVVIAASADIQQMVSAGRFREDLFSWLNVGTITVPPLRHRDGDIGTLSKHFLTTMSDEMNRAVPTLSPEVKEVFAAYDWPGNIRELQNTIKRILVICGQKEISLDDLPDTIVQNARIQSHGDKEGLFELRELCLGQFELKYLTDILGRHCGNVLNSAKKAGVPRGTFYRLMKKYNINPADFRSKDL